MFFVFITYLLLYISYSFFWDFLGNFTIFRSANHDSQHRESVIFVAVVLSHYIVLFSGFLSTPIFYQVANKSK